MTTLNTTIARLPDFAIETALEYRAEIKATFELLATPSVRDSFSPQQVMVMAAAHHGFFAQTGHVYLRGSDDVFVKTNPNTSYGFRICSDGELWLADSIGRMAE